MLECFSNKQTILNDKTSSNMQHPSSHSRIQPTQNKQKCLHCQQSANLLCYACCMQTGCQKCYDPKHFIDCDRQFNKFTISLTPAHGLEESRSKRNGKKSKTFQKCKRCEIPSQQFEQCLQCKTILCKNCSDQLHSKGKFIKHRRNLSSSPEKKRPYQAALTENCEQSRMDRKQNLETFDYGLKLIKQDKSKTKVANFNKMGRSIAKVPFQNHQNTPNKKYRRNSMNQSIDQNIKQSKCEPPKQNYQKWQLCPNHNKLRNIFTQTYDLVCTQCYEQVKTSVAKLRVVDTNSWMKNQIQKQAIFSQIQSSVSQIQHKQSEICNSFRSYRNELEVQLNKKCQILEQRFKTNIFQLEKWQNQYKLQLSQLRKHCQSFLKIKEKLQLTTQPKKQAFNILNLHSYLVYQQIMKERKEFNLQLQQYQFKISEINTFQFEDMLKNFAFARRKIQGESNYPVKSLSKMSQSHQLRQSRVSNSSLTTDRKLMKKQQSALKSNYYELSNGGNLMKRSISKQVKEDLTKDISQKVLFPINNVKSDKKQKLQKQLIKPPQVRTSNYFFESAPDESCSQFGGKILKKEGQVLNLGHKQAKYINLQTIITQKLEKTIENHEKRQILQLSTPGLGDDSLKKSIYLGEITEELPRNNENQSTKTILPDHRLTYSIIMTQSITGKTTQETINSNNSINSNNVNIQSVKNKRKSDYMQMRDRLRKPNLIQKIGK